MTINLIYSLFKATKKKGFLRKDDTTTTISKIDHNGYQLLFSRNSKLPIEEILSQNSLSRNRVPKETRAIQTDINFRQLREVDLDEEQSPRQSIQYVPVVQQQPQAQIVQQLVHEMPSTNYQDQSGNQ